MASSQVSAHSQLLFAHEENERVVSAILGF